MRNIRWIKSEPTSDIVISVCLICWAMMLFLVLLVEQFHGRSRAYTEHCNASPRLSTAPPYCLHSLPSQGVGDALLPWWWFGSDFGVGVTSLLLLLPISQIDCLYLSWSSGRGTTRTWPLFVVVFHVLIVCRLASGSQEQSNHIPGGNITCWHCQYLQRMLSLQNKCILLPFFYSIQLLEPSKQMYHFTTRSSYTRLLNACYSYTGKLFL